MAPQLSAGAALLASAIFLASCADVASPSIPTVAVASASPDDAGAGNGPAPVAAWELNGDGGATAGGVLTFTGVHEFTDDAVALDGRTSYGATSGSGPLDTTSSFTAAAWVSIAREAEFVSALSQVGTVAAAFYLGIGDGAWSFAMKDLDTNDPGHTIRALADPPVVDPATWVHLAGVFDETAGELRLFIDGALAATTPFDAPWQAHGPLAVGAAQAHGVPSDFWPGAVAQAAVYQAALTDDQIARLLESTRPTAMPPVLTILTDPGTYVEGILDGTWDLTLSEEQVESLITTFSPEEAAAVGLPGADTKIRVGFVGNTWWLGFVFDEELWMVGGVPEGDGGIFAVDGDKMVVTNGVDGWDTFRWSVDGDTLTMTHIGCVPQAGAGECKPGLDFLPDVLVYTFSGSDASY